MEIKPSWTRPTVVEGSAPLEPCPRCSSIGPCCDSALMRGQTAASLARLVDKQRERIKELETKLEQALDVRGDPFS